MSSEWLKLPSSNIVEKDNFRGAYRKKRKEYVSIIESVLAEEMHDENIISIVDWLRSEEKNLTNSFDDIMLSVIHMCCNRLNGNRELESKTYSLLRHALYDAIAKEKHITA